MADYERSEIPRVSRSGRVLKKSVKLKEFEETLEEEVIVERRGKKRKRSLQSAQCYISPTKAALEPTCSVEPSSVPSQYGKLSNKDYMGPVCSDPLLAVSLHRKQMTAVYSSEDDEALSIDVTSDEEMKGEEYLSGHTAAARSSITRHVSSNLKRRASANTRKRNFKSGKMSNVNSLLLWKNGKIVRMAARNPNITCEESEEHSQKGAEMWQALLPKKKEVSQRTVQSIPPLDFGRSHTKKITIEKELTQLDISESRSMSESEESEIDQLTILGTAPIDTASHLLLLGESMTALGKKVYSLEKPPNMSGIYTALLDMLLCSVGSLLCLTSVMPGLEDKSKDVHLKILDHIAYFLPGLR